MSSWAQFSLQTASSWGMEELLLFHDYANACVALILAAAGSALCFSLSHSFTVFESLHSDSFETICCAIPILILVWMASKSIPLLYLLEVNDKHEMVVKVIGHQWYWDYELSQSENFTEPISFSAYMVPEGELSSGLLRQLEVDARLVLPAETEIWGVVTSADVLHSWAIPSLGVKMDAIPGRLNRVQFNIKMSGVFYGQCSEICGAHHSGMPIVIQAIPSSLIKPLS